MFVTLPLELSEEIREVGALAGPPRGFGSLPVEVRVGGSVWRTSVFPDRNTRCYVLPVKAAVRKAEDLEVEDRIAVSLQPLV